MGRVNLTPEEALALFRALDEQESGCEDTTSSSGSEYSIENCSHTDVTSSDQSDEQPSPPPPPSKRMKTQQAEAAQASSSYNGKDGTAWLKVPPHQGRMNSSNVFSGRQGIPRHVQKLRSEADYFLLFFPPSMLRKVAEYTSLEYKRVNGSAADLDLSIEELLVFIGLTIARGVLCGRGEPLSAFWSKDYGRDIFRQSMIRQRYQEILRYLRFDDKSTRSRRKEKDKFCQIREIWDNFVMQCQTHWHPSCFLTVDEQLFPTKARCPFTQYMPNKPGKFGIKFWLLCDSESAYVLNAQPYLGRNYDENRGNLQLGEHVVMRLMEPYFGRGHNVTTDNFFTSKKLSLLLAKHKTTLVGTVRANRRELPSLFTDKKRALHSVLQGYDLESHALLLSYKAKKDRVVNVLSTMHSVQTNVSMDGSAKPNVIQFYNKTKGGVDTADQMCRHFSSKAGCRRWPVQVFCNMLDIASVNSFILWSKTHSDKRRAFLLQVVDQLVKPFYESKCLPPTVGSTIDEISEPYASVRRKCKGCKKNMTKHACPRCTKPVCGSCRSNLCKLCAGDAKLGS